MLPRHQTGHNSGVLHSGIYYKPGSMKAATCRAGREAMIAFCDREGIVYDLCGKVIVAVDEAELGRLDGLVRRGTDNGVSCERVSSAHLRDLEPHAAGIGGIIVHDTGIVDFKQVCAKLVSTLRERGCEIRTGVRVDGLIEQPGTVTVRTDGEELEAQVVVNCAGLHSDRVAKLGDNRAPAGVRAQAIAPDGKLLDDFAFSETRRIVHVVNAPSPAATASLSIGEFIAGKVAERF